MPNQTLLDQLDRLRETYTQQQKTTAALQTAFKAVTNAHGKAQKVLREYSTQNGPLAVENAQDAFAGLRLKEETIDPLVPELRREVKNLATLVAALRDAAIALRAEPVDVVRLDRARTLLLTARPADIRELLPALGDELDLAQRSLGDEFGQKLRAGLAEQGIAIGGRAPKFEIGRFELEANFAKRFLVLRYGKDSVVPHIPITVEAAIRAYQGASKLIAGRNVDGKAWVSQFYDAYQIVRRKRPAAGTRVNIVECYVEMVLLRQGRAFFSEPAKRTFADYMRAQFIYDFFEFADRRRLAHDGQVIRAHTATKSVTENPTKSMWIVEGDTPYDGRFIADVEFVKD